MKAGNAGLRTRNTPDDASAEPRGPGADPGAGPDAEPRGWHSRGYIPHFDSTHVIQHVTFHLADSLPRETVERMAAEIQALPPDRRDIEKRRRLEALVDAGHGACWLRRPECARIVQDALLHFDGQRYQMIAWVVMPNHVHTLFQTLPGWSLNTVVGSWKTFTANAIGRIVREPGQPSPHVWHPEFWDRYIRNSNHFATALAYIHENPVKAGLVGRPEDWPWTSAGSAPGNAGLRTRNTPEDASAEPRGPGPGPDAGAPRS
jgi:REP element-mobilizing transposase RayT